MYLPLKKSEMYSFLLKWSMTESTETYSFSVEVGVDHKTYNESSGTVRRTSRKSERNKKRELLENHNVETTTKALWCKITNIIHNSQRKLHLWVLQVKICIIEELLNKGEGRKSLRLISLQPE